MKKIYILLLVALLVVTTTALGKSAMRSSYYYASPNTTTGAALHSDLGWVTFGASAFDGQNNGGLFTLQGDTFTTTYTGLVKVTGNCRQGKPSDIALQVVIGNDFPVTVAATNSEAFTFVYPFMANNFRLQGVNFSIGRYDVIKCALLFEAVG